MQHVFICEKSSFTPNWLRVFSPISKLCHLSFQIDSYANNKNQGIWQYPMTSWLDRHMCTYNKVQVWSDHGFIPTESILSFVTYQHVLNNTWPNQVFLETLRRLKGSTSLMMEQNDVAMVDKLLLSSFTNESTWWNKQNFSS